MSDIQHKERFFDEFVNFINEQAISKDFIDIGKLKKVVFEELESIKRSLILYLKKNPSFEEDQSEAVDLFMGDSMIPCYDNLVNRVFPGLVQKRDKNLYNIGDYIEDYLLSINI